MAYIGKSIESGTFKVLDTSGNTYNGSNTTFSLGTQVGAAAQLLVSHDGVIQLPGTDYTLASGGTQITFSTAPASGASIFIVEISGAVGGTVTPSDNSVGITQLNVSDGSNGQALTTNGSGTLSFSTISSNTPSSADGQALGSASLEWSDLFLADGGEIKFGNDQDVSLIHNADKGLKLKSTATSDDTPAIFTLQTGDTDIGDADVIGKIEFQAPDEASGTDAILVGAAIQAVAVGDFSSSANAMELQFMTAESATASAKMRIRGDGKVGISPDGNAPDLGTGLHIRTSDTGASVSSGMDELVLENGSANCGLTILTANDGVARIAFGDDGDSAAGGTDYFHDGNYYRIYTAGSERVRIDGSGDFLVAKTSADAGSNGGEIRNNGMAVFTRSGDNPLILNRNTDDGRLVDFKGQNTTEGEISVSGSTVSYNSFAGSHWSRLADNSQPTILRGTVMESIATMCDWYRVKFDINQHDSSKDEEERTEEIALPDGKSVGDAIKYTFQGVEYDGVIEKQNNERLPMCKISDTEDSKAVYGVFMTWDNQPDDGVNDMYVTALGAFVVRIHKDETVAIGDLLSSKGDGTAKKQADDILRASTIAKVTSTEKTHEYADGSYCVPCTLHCG